MVEPTLIVSSITLLMLYFTSFPPVVRVSSIRAVEVDECDYKLEIVIRNFGGHTDELDWEVETEREERTRNRGNGSFSNIWMLGSRKIETSEFYKQDDFKHAKVEISQKGEYPIFSKEFSEDKIKNFN